MVITGGVGAIFGAACSGVHPRRRLVILGALTGVFWYYLADAVFWKRINPLVPLYAPQTATLLSHALFGACLGYMGRKGEEEPSELSPVPVAVSSTSKKPPSESAPLCPWKPLR